MRDSDKKVIDKPGHAPGLLVHDREKSPAGGGIVAGRSEQRLGEADQRRQRRLQLVPGIGDEIRPHLFGPLQGGDVVGGQERDRAVEHRPAPIAMRARCARNTRSVEIRTG